MVLHNSRCDLCIELGAWTPSDSPPGEPRSSPALVDAFFTSLERSGSVEEEEVFAHTSSLFDFSLTEESVPLQQQQQQQQQVFNYPLFLFPSHSADASPFVLPSYVAAKRPLDVGQSVDEGEEAPGPSWKVAKRGEHHVHAASAASVSAAAFQPSTAAAAAAAAVGAAASQPSTAAAAAAASVGAAASQPTTSAATAAAASVSAAAPQPTTSAATAAAAAAVVRLRSHLPRRCRPEDHPYVQLPSLAPGVRARRFSPNVMRLAHRPLGRPCGALLKLRELFRMQSLDQAHAGLVVFFAEEAANNAYFYMQDEVSTQKPVLAATYLGRRFLVLYSLLCASQALNQNWPKEPWWEELMNRIPHKYSDSSRSHSRNSRINLALATDLSAAIAKLKKGTPLPPATVVDLFRRLFCMHTSPYLFRERVWDPWRQDDEEGLF
ncbi:hypothetical protein Emed_002659 [Eimeria media]